MTPQSLLLNLAKTYDFTPMIRRLSDPSSRAVARPWLAMELGPELAQVLDCELVGYHLPYQQQQQQQQQQQYFRYDVKSNQVRECEKRLASKADIQLNYPLKPCRPRYFECHYLHYTKGDRASIWHKWHQDMARVCALRQAMQTEVHLLTALWGSITPAECEHFKYVDNTHHAAYALDTTVYGSSQVSRLLQVEKSTEPRLWLIAV
ncbi:hypothetical protein HGP28_03535 [Vibrio sp. SM6]|uniref:Uncharacterized protein n=1 Tax=Vibrio agarilyticus TaxID=2726741 RepID=A0A7X8YG35_9VIBR|nr:hypothetical protein [Vibrio agarilyticus]NLS11962.1 hypothetical protein [Vibrio agarilyticus]